MCLIIEVFNIERETIVIDDGFQSNFFWGRRWNIYTHKECNDAEL